MSEDERFATLVSQWQGDFLGREKDEGVGLLWKEGGWVELVAELQRVAPRTARRLAEHLAASKESLVLNVLDALAITDRTAREERFRQLDLAPPFAPFRQVMESIEPPMPTRFARRIEAWLDLASGIETRGARPEVAPPSAVGREVTHGKFGRGVIRAVEPGPMEIATVEFADGSTRRLAMRFLEQRES